MKKQELSARYNDMIVGLILEGYSLNMNELKGGYGFFGQQTCFSKGNEYAVMWMEKEYSHGFGPDEIHCYIAMFEVKPGELIEFDYGWPKQWKEHLVSEEVFYEVERDSWYIESSEEAEHVGNVRYDRCKLRAGRSNRKELEVTDGMMRVIRRMDGFKTIKRSDIKVERTDSCYIVTNTRSRNTHIVRFVA